MYKDNYLSIYMTTHIHRTYSPNRVVSILKCWYECNGMDMKWNEYRPAVLLDIYSKDYTRTNETTSYY